MDDLRPILPSNLIPYFRAESAFGTQRRDRSVSSAFLEEHPGRTNRPAGVALMRAQRPHQGTPGAVSKATWDRRREMAQDAAITAALSMPVFFCNPNRPWQL